MLKGMDIGPCNNAWTLIKIGPYPSIGLLSIFLFYLKFFRIKSNSPVKEITTHSDSSTRVAPKSCPLARSDEGGSSKIAINTT